MSKNQKLQDNQRYLCIICKLENLDKFILKNREISEWEFLEVFLNGFLTKQREFVVMVDTFYLEGF